MFISPFCFPFLLQHELFMIIISIIFSLNLIKNLILIVLNFSQFRVFIICLLNILILQKFDFIQLESFVSKLRKFKFIQKITYKIYKMKEFIKKIEKDICSVTCIAESVGAWKFWKVSFQAGRFPFLVFLINASKKK